MAESVDAGDLKSSVERRPGSSPGTRIMSKTKRIICLILETWFIVLNLLEYVTSSDGYYQAFVLALALVFMGLFILDWNALFNDKEGE